MTFDENGLLDNARVGNSNSSRVTCDLDCMFKYRMICFIVIVALCVAQHRSNVGQKM